jgi:hypothetical protein
MANIFTLKRGDTLPVLEVALKNPDGTAHDLTGSTGWYLHVRLNDDDDTVVTRSMTAVGVASDGILRYAWQADDWDDENVAGYLIAGPTLPLVKGQREHRMEYEVVGGSGACLTFPNDGYDVLRVVGDIGQGDA